LLNEPRPRPRGVVRNVTAHDQIRMLPRFRRLSAVGLFMDYSRLTLVMLVIDWRFCWSLIVHRFIYGLFPTYSCFVGR
jgi:hypothetical protein